jgi:hypothetical protein
MTEDAYSTGTVGVAAYLNFVGGANPTKTYGLGTWGTMVGRLTYAGVIVADTDPPFDAE